MYIPESVLVMKEHAALPVTNQNNNMENKMHLYEVVFIRASTPIYYVANNINEVCTALTVDGEVPEVELIRRMFPLTAILEQSPDNIDLINNMETDFNINEETYRSPEQKEDDQIAYERHVEQRPEAGQFHTMWCANKSCHSFEITSGPRNPNWLCKACRATPAI